MEPLQLTLILLGATWASLNVQIAGYKAVNEKRDIIIAGRNGELHLSEEHRRIMFFNDWLPLKLGLGLVSLIFFVLILAMPLLLPVEKRTFLVWAMVGVVSTTPLFAATCWLIFGYSDYQLIRKTLAQEGIGIVSRT